MKEPLDSRYPPLVEQAPTVYSRIGAEPLGDFAIELYRRIDADTTIRPMFPSDLSPTSDAVRDMREFLIQFFGGPAEYSERKGHPRLRARHMRFAITQAARDAWFSHALSALATIVDRHGLSPETARDIRGYFDHASRFMINQSE